MLHRHSIRHNTIASGRRLVLSCSYAELMRKRSNASRYLTAPHESIERLEKASGQQRWQRVMSSFAPQPVRTRYHFEIAQSERGYWVAMEKEGLIGGIFRTQKDALRFALFEVGGDNTCVRVLPAEGSLNTRPVSGSRERSAPGFRRGVRYRRPTYGKTEAA